MFGFTKRHEHEWRLTRLEENDKTMLSTLNEIKIRSKSSRSKIYDIKLDRNFRCNPEGQGR